MGAKRTDLLIQPSDRIFVAGHRGMAGSAIVRALRAGGYTTIGHEALTYLPRSDEATDPNVGYDVEYNATVSGWVVLAAGSYDVRLQCQLVSGPEYSDAGSVVSYASAELAAVGAAT